MKFWVVRNNWFPIGYYGIVLWPFVFVRPCTTETQNKILFRHELQHCYQIQERGVVRFYARYLWLALKHGYRNHPDEVEARANQVDALKPNELEWYEKNKITL